MSSQSNASASGSGSNNTFGVNTAIYSATLTGASNDSTSSGSSIHSVDYELAPLYFQPVQDDDIIATVPNSPISSDESFETNVYGYTSPAHIRDRAVELMHVPAEHFPQALQAYLNDHHGNENLDDYLLCSRILKEVHDVAHYVPPRWGILNPTRQHYVLQNQVHTNRVQGGITAPARAPTPTDPRYTPNLDAFRTLGYFNLAEPQWSHIWYIMTEHHLERIRGIEAALREEIKETYEEMYRARVQYALCVGADPNEDGETEYAPGAAPSHDVHEFWEWITVYDLDGTGRLTRFTGSTPMTHHTRMKTVNGYWQSDDFLIDPSKRINREFAPGGPRLYESIWIYDDCWGYTSNYGQPHAPGMGPGPEWLWDIATHWWVHPDYRTATCLDEPISILCGSLKTNLEDRHNFACFNKPHYTRVPHPGHSYYVEIIDGFQNLLPCDQYCHNKYTPTDGYDLHPDLLLFYQKRGKGRFYRCVPIGQTDTRRGDYCRDMSHLYSKVEGCDYHITEDGLVLPCLDKYCPYRLWNPISHAFWRNQSHWTDDFREIKQRLRLRLTSTEQTKDFDIRIKELDEKYQNRYANRH